MKVRTFNIVTTAKSTVILIAVGFVMLLLAGNSTSNAKNSTVTNRQSGARIYAAHCISCHGSNGRSKTARGRRKGATDLTKSRISTARGVRVIRNGRSSMPSFKKDLSAKQISRVNSYVRQFRK